MRRKVRIPPPESRTNDAGGGEPGILLLSVVQGALPVGLAADAFETAVVALGTLAVLVHILALRGDAITHRGGDWGMRALTLRWLSAGAWVGVSLVLTLRQDLLSCGRKPEGSAAWGGGTFRVAPWD